METMQELVAAFNKVSDKPVKRFSSVAAGKARLAKVMAEKAVRKGQPQTKKTQSEAIAQTWIDKDVAAKRAQRYNVRVAGKEYRSVAEAFRELKLEPFAAHIKFRAQLAADKKKTFTMQGNEFVFEIVTKDN